MKKIKINFYHGIQLFIYDLVFILHLGIAFIIRWPYVFTERMESDEALYAWCAQRIYAHPSIIFSKEIIEYHPPFFSLILSLGNISSDPHVAYRVMALIFSLLGIVSIYILGTVLSSRFVGLVCAILLTFNYLYLLDGTLIMPDVPLLVLCNLLLIILAKVNITSGVSRHICIGIISALIILVKWSGIVVIPFLIAYYLLFPRERSLSFKIRKLFIPLTIVSGLILFLMINNQIQLRSLLPDVDTLTGRGHEVSPLWFYVGNIHNILMILYILPLFFYGVHIILRTNYRYKILLLTYLIIFLASISLTPVKVLRYSLMILPVVLIICGLGLEELLNQFYKKSKKIWIGKVIAICVIYLLCWHYYPKMEILLKRSFSTSTGLAEAGQWIKQNTDANTTIISQNLRPIRYFSGINFHQFGGQLLLLPQHKTDFEHLVIKTKGHIILQVDLWSESNPSDFYPFSKAKQEEHYFNSLGFRLSKEIKREVYFRDNKKGMIPVIKLYER